MSELKARHIVDVYYSYYAENPFGERSQVYLKSEADKVIADLEESHKMEVEQLLMEIVELKKQVRDYAQGLYVIQARAEKGTRHQKYKRCLAMAKECVYGEIKLKRVKMRDMNNHQFWQFDNDYWQKWNNRWLKIAEQFKENG